mmetsp:Transcript_19941/g.60272  ORF Transcript_19941/g.60272 Transcript_19941/m.60272 type:complete len:88 (-) Transcript_19941:3178-3441(-)
MPHHCDVVAAEKALRCGAKLVAARQSKEDSRSAAKQQKPVVQLGGALPTMMMRPAAARGAGSFTTKPVATAQAAEASGPAGLRPVPR